MKRQLCLALALATVLGGCSFVMTSGPRDDGHPPRSYPDCTRSMTWPIVDAVFSALFLVAMFGAIADDDMTATDPSDDEASKAEKVSSSALFAAATGIGAYVGYNRVSRCRGATERFRAAYPYGYQPYPYPQPYYPPQQHPPQQYPPQQYPPPYAPQSSQPSPLPPPGPPPAPSTTPPPSSTVPTALGTEGDVCSTNAECATGLTCTSNVCVRPK